MTVEIVTYKMLWIVFFDMEEEFEDTKGVIRICNWGRTDNKMSKKKKDTQRSIKHTHKTKDRVTRTPLKSEGELMCSGRVSSSCLLKRILDQ